MRQPTSSSRGEKSPWPRDVFLESQCSFLVQGTWDPGIHWWKATSRSSQMEAQATAVCSPRPMEPPRVVCVKVWTELGWVGWGTWGVHTGAASLSRSGTELVQEVKQVKMCWPKEEVRLCCLPCFRVEREGIGELAVYTPGLPGCY